MKTAIMTLSALAVTLSPTFAAALPMKYSRCADAGRIQSPANSAGFYLSDDCRTVYVLPPETGAVSIASYVDETGLGGALCSGQNGTIQEMGDRRRSLESERDQIDHRLQDLAAQRARNGQGCVGADGANANAHARLKANQDEQSRIATQLKQLEGAIAACTGDDCPDQRDRRDQLQDRLDSLRTLADTLQQGADRYAARQSACHDALTRADQAASTETSQREARLQVIKSEITKTVNAINALYESGRADPGAQMSVVIASGQTDLVKGFQQLNASLPAFQFMAMPLTAANLSFTEITDGNPSGYPVLLKADVQGVNLHADNSMNTVPFSMNTSEHEQVFMGAAVGGSLTINRFSACQLPSADDYGGSGVSQARRLRDIAGLLGGTVTYQYSLGVHRKISINYNEKQLYCMIRKQSTSNGLFSTSSSSSITESSQASQWLSIVVSSEDPGFDFANRDSMLLDLRQEMLDRALMKVATSYLSRERAALVAPGEAAAGAISAKPKEMPEPVLPGGRDRARSGQRALWRHRIDLHHLRGRGCELGAATGRQQTGSCFRYADLPRPGQGLSDDDPGAPRARADLAVRRSDAAALRAAAAGGADELPSPPVPARAGGGEPGLFLAGAGLVRASAGCLSGGQAGPRAGVSRALRAGGRRVVGHGERGPDRGGVGCRDFRCPFAERHLRRKPLRRSRRDRLRCASRGCLLRQSPARRFPGGLPGGLATLRPLRSRCRALPAQGRLAFAGVRHRVLEVRIRDADRFRSLGFRPGTGTEAGMSGGRWPFFAIGFLAALAPPAWAGPDCAHAGLARVLDGLAPVGRLHNCRIELVTRQSPVGPRQYMLLVNDRSPLGGIEHPPVSFELAIDPTCLAGAGGAIEPRTFVDSFGYTDAGPRLPGRSPTADGMGGTSAQLAIQEIDLASGQVDRRVECRLDWEGL